jgi:hypothetical protein
MQVKKLSILGILFFLLVIPISIYWYLNGTPIGKYVFKKEVQKYLDLSYSDDMKVNNIEFSFKRSTKKQRYYSAEVYVTSNPIVKFSVFRNDTFELTDNLVSLIWRNAIYNKLDTFLSSQYSRNGYSLNIYLPSSGVFSPEGSISVDEIPQYEAYIAKKEIEDRISIDISIRKELTDSDLGNVLQAIEFAKQNKLLFNRINFDYLDRKIGLNWFELMEVKDMNRLLEYMD